MKTTKKLLSVLLAIMMIVTSISVCFSTLAAGGTATEAQWSALEAALKKDTIANANFSNQTVNNYTVNDPDGSVLAAVEAYWSVFNTLANKSPAADTGGDEGNRTINQVNDSIKAELSTRMGADYADYNVENFITKLISGASVTSDLSTERNNTNGRAPGSNLSAVAAVNLTVQADATLLSYATVEDLPDELTLSKTFTVNHTNANYNHWTTSETDGCGNTTTTHYYRYYYNISGTSEKENTEDVRYVKNIKTEIAPYDPYFFEYDLVYLVDEVATETLSSVKSAVNTIYGKLSTEVWNHFYGAYDVPALVADLDLAAEIIRVGTLAFRNTELKEAGYAGYDKAQLEALYSELTVGINAFEAASQAAKDFIVGRSYDHEAVKVYAAAVLREIELLELRALKATIDATIPEYYTYNDDNVTDGTVTGATLSAAKGTVDGFIRAIGTYVPANVAEVMPEYADVLGKLSEELGRLITVAGYTADFSAKYATYVAEVYKNTNLADDSADLLAAVKGYDDWYTGLKNLLAEIETELGTGLAEKIFDGLDADMKAHMDSRYNALHARVDAQIDIAKELYELILSYEGEIGIVNINTYSKYQKAFGLIEKDVYDFLIASANFAMPQETIDKYNSLGDIKAEYDEFVATGGFNSFVQSAIEYKNREVLLGDILRDEEFEVTAEKLENVIAGLDALIGSDLVGDLLGGLLGGEGGNLGDMLTGMVKDMLFTDSFINTVVQALYPLILGELLKAWEKDLPNMTADLGVDIMGYLSKDLYTIVGETGLALYPAQYATALKNIDSKKYADNIAKLSTAGKEHHSTITKDEETGEITDIVLESTPWTDEGAAYIDPETGSLNLTWGVDAVRENGGTPEEIEEAFYVAFDDAFDSLKPLFHALLGNTAFSKSVQKVVDMSFLGSANLNLDASGNRGYANMLVPIYEILGVEFTAPTTVEGYTKQANSLELILKAVLDPIFAFLGNLGEAPLSTLIGVLPNLFYALSMQMVVPLLNMLKTGLRIGLSLGGMLGGCIAGCLPDDMDINNLYTMDVKIGEMVFTEDFAIDVSGGLNTILPGLGLNLPEFDQGLLATLGELGTVDTSRADYIYSGLEGTGTAYSIEADKAAVAYYLLTYIFGLLKDEAAFTGLLGMFMTVKDENGEAVLDENGNKIPDEEKIAGVLGTLDGIGLLGVDVGNAIGAVVELFNQEKADLAEYTWFEGIAGYDPLATAYNGNNWTKETADYIADNLGAVLEEVGLDLAGTIGGLFTNANITTLAKLLSGLDLNELLGGLFGGDDEENAEIETVAEGEEGGEGEAEAAPAIDITALLKDILGVDLGAFAQYAEIADDTTWGFEDGDVEGFAAALADLFAPLKGILDFILAGKDINLLDATTLYGYNGYENAFAPLLKALGCDVAELGEDDDALVLILNALAAKITEVIANPAEILSILPGLLYYLRSDALTVAVKNLLTPVYVIIDTIRPIYDLDIYGLIGGLTADKLGFELRLDNLSLAAIFDLITTLLADKLGDMDITIFNILIDELATVYVNGTEYSNGDILTVILNSIVSKIRDNEDYQNFLGALLDMLLKEDSEITSEAILTLIANVFNIANMEIKEIDWQFTEYADTDEAISALEKSEIYINHKYGPLYTEEMAQEIADDFGTFVDNVLYLLGIEMNGEKIESLADVLGQLDGIVNGSVYNSEMIETIRGALVSVGALVNELPVSANLNATIKEVIKMALGVDLGFWDTFVVPEFEGDRDMFVETLCDMLAPLNAVLKWLLADEDIAFFSDAEKKNLITLPGAEGYAYGIIPLLEALGCEDIVTSADYNAAVAADESVLLTSILNPLLNRVDEILADPANEILAMLTNLIYFINSNGVDAVVKNTLNSVFTLLNAIAPIKEIDLYALIGLDLETLDFAKLFDMLLDLIADATGYELEGIDADALAELTVGKVESFTSANGETAYRMVYTNEAGEAEMVTVVGRLIISFIMTGENREALLNILKENFDMDDDSAKYVEALLNAIAGGAVDTYLGMDAALATIYYVFTSADTVIGSTASGLKDLNAKWQQILKDLGKTEAGTETTVGNIIAVVLDTVIGDILGSDGIAPNGLIAFFKQIADFFQRIIDWFKNLFN